VEEWAELNIWSSKRQWIDIRWKRRQNWISCPHLKRQWIDIRWTRGAELDILSSIKGARDWHKVEKMGRTRYPVLNKRGHGLT
jgi:hypothetical protein